MNDGVGERWPWRGVQSPLQFQGRLESVPVEMGEAEGALTTESEPGVIRSCQSPSIDRTPCIGDG